MTNEIPDIPPDMRKVFRRLRRRRHQQSLFYSKGQMLSLAKTR